MTAVYQFLPWVRAGAAGAIATPDTLDGTLAARATLDVAVQINGTSTAANSVRLFGPGDVTGFDQRLVVRTDPTHQSAGFEPNYFPVVEFDWPELPWLFTPAAATPQEQLRPWICLVVVLRRDGVKLGAGAPLPVLTIDEDAETELPPLAESWAWAHAQVSGQAAAGQTLAALMQESPERAISRLVCPRRLRSNKSYYACVVPTFEVGRRAGLGLSVDETATLAPAWPAPGDAAWAAATPLRLPVYFSWEFATGVDGEFESLVRRLEPRPVPATVGTRPLETAPVPNGGFPPGAPLPPLEGALRVRGQPTSKHEVAALESALGAPAAQTSVTTSAPLAPPLYGRWHAARSDLTAPGWLRELNLDPRWRAAAGFGARIVQEQQEQLMASAWEQVGEIERANQLLRQAQLARSAGGAVHARCLTRLAKEYEANPDMPAAALLQLTAPAHSRVATNAGTVTRDVRASRFPAAAVSPQFRRATRPGGPLARRVDGGAGGAARNLDLLGRLATGELTAAPPRPRPQGMVTVEDPRDAARSLAAATPDAIQRRLDAGGGEAAFARAAMAHQGAVLGMIHPSDRDPPGRPKLDLTAVQAMLLQRLDPEQTVPRRTLARIKFRDASWKPADPLELLMAAPEFPTPMYRFLADLSQDLLLPGLEQVPQNSITLLDTNTRFVEAFMMGLNHEMGRELLWREYPTDQRGSYFRQFWDPSGRLPRPASAAAAYDVPPLHTWEPGASLGQSMTGGAGASTVLLVRGELLRRYPGAIISAVKGEWDTSGGTPAEPRSPKAQPTADERKFPIFHGTLLPDITFLGFDLSSTDAIGRRSPADGQPGWFFVIEQPPTEARFGFGEDEKAPPPTWRDLAWPHVPTTAAGYVSLSAALAGFPAPATPAGVSWGATSNAAALAYITLQLPFRIAIHASNMLPVP